jgi:S-adenosylmethionine:tRNA ribosyltransferase-isomerase
LEKRDSSRLLVVDRKSKTFKEIIFSEVIDLLKPRDLLVLNNTRVIKARLYGQKTSGAKLEILLLKKLEENVWQALVNPAKKAKPGETIIFEKDRLSAKILDKNENGARILKFFGDDFKVALDKLGKTPTPPYIKTEIKDLEKYQTIYAQIEGAVAAPTAGLHFTAQLLKKIEAKGVRLAYVTLHCGLATFRPVKSQDIREHEMEEEWVEISPAAAKTINEAKKSSSRIIAVGTTCVRSLETAADYNQASRFYGVKPFCGPTPLYITPGYEFKIVNCILTNFHTPASTNLILASSFCGTGLLKEAYGYAIKKNFRFYSFGDAMFIA